MNSKHTHKFKALLALFLSISMLFSMAVTSFAALPQDVVDENGDIGQDGVIKYVSIGDSVTNGYGLDEYYFYDDNGKRINSTGFRRYVPTSYPYLISEILGEALDMPVELDPMAIAGMRFSDLRLILDESFGGDTYMGDENGDGQLDTVWRYNDAVEHWLDMYLKGEKHDPNGTIDFYLDHYNYVEKGQSLNYREKWEILNNEFKLSIAKADFISIDLGSNDFGTYLTDRLMDYVQGEAFNSGKADYQRFELFLDKDSAESLENMIYGMVKNAGYSETLEPVIADLVDTLLYGLIAFCGNFDACMELIFDLNPNAQVMIIDAYNMMSSVKIDGRAVFGEGIDVSDIMNMFITVANFYTKELSPYASKVVHVDIGADSYPDLVMDYFNDFSGWKNLAAEEGTFAANEARTIMKLLLEEFLGDTWATAENQILTIDAMEDDISGSINENVVKTIISNSKDSVDGVALIKQAVDGVALAESLVNTIVTTYVDVLFVKGYLPEVVKNYHGTVFESTIRSNIKNTVSDLLKDESLAGMLPENVTTSVLSDMVYDVALAYGHAATAAEQKLVVKSAVLEILMLVQNCDEVFANLIYSVVEAYNDNSNTTDKERMVAALTVYLSTDSTVESPAATAELAYAVSNIYDAVEVKGVLADSADLTTVLTAMYGMGPNVVLTEDQINAIGVCYAGDYDDEDLVTAVCSLMILGGYGDSVDMYLLYHKFPYTLSEIAQSNTIYLDSFLPYLAGKSLDFAGIAARFFDDENPLVLTEPNRADYATDEAYKDAFDLFKHDSTLLTVYIRFLSLTGLFVHPNSTGHATFTDVIEDYLDCFVPNEALGEKFIFDDDHLVIDGEDEYYQYSVVSLGGAHIYPSDSSEIDSYGSIVAEVFNSDCTFIETNDLTVGEILSNIESGKGDYSGIKDNDIILLNVGAWNTCYIARVLGSGEKVPDLTDIDILQTSADNNNSLGDRFDSLLGGNDPMMQFAKAFLYGYVDFANSIEDLVVELQSEGATVILVGLGDLMGEGSNIAFNNAKFDLDLLIDKITTDFNGHMEVIADKYTGCYYIKTSDIANEVSTSVELSDSIDETTMADFMEMMHETIFGYDAHTEIAKRILCDVLNIHAPSDEPLKTIAPTCQEEGELIYASCDLCYEEASVMAIIRYTEKVDHSYNYDNVYEWVWDNDYKSAKAYFKCEWCDSVEDYEAEITSEDSSTCKEAGKITYTAIVTVNETEYKDSKEIDAEALSHVYGDPVWTWAEDYSGVTATFTCTECGDVQVVEAEIESETTKSTCKAEGKVVYTATAVFGDDEKEFTDSKTVVLELGDHDYVDDICSVCGEKDPDARPDESGDCVYVTEEELDADGVYTLTFDGEELGEFEFVAVGGGWTIADENGDYLAIVDGELVYGSDAFVWTFENGMFSAEETIIKEVSGGFWGGLFGGTKEPEEITTKYYLAVVDGEIDLDENGDVAEFSVKHHDDKHNYDEGVVTEPTCEDKGYTTYTCEKCGEECIYNERETVDHKYVDGECEYCGNEEDSEEEPEEPVENCIYIKEVDLEEDGSYLLTIGDDELGEFTITKVGKGWTILDESDNTYLAFLNGMLVYTDVEFVWDYEDGKFFYEDVQTVVKSNGFWGGLFGNSTKTETIVTVYYIVVEDNKVIVSEDDSDADVVLEIFVVEEGHDYVDGKCENCGKHEDDSCVYFESVELEEDGDYVLVLNGEEVDTFTFENVDEDIWTIKNADGEYVALEDGKIVYTDAEFEWTYNEKKHVFSAEIVKVSVNSGFWGGLFGGSGSTTKVTTYYLVAVDGELEVSTSNKTAVVEFLAEIVDEHVYGDAECFKGFNVHTCENCGIKKVEIAE